MFTANPPFSAVNLPKIEARSLTREKALTLMKAFALIFAVGLVAHWPALISDSNMWDDWIILAWITQTRLDWMFQFFNNYGVTPYYLVYFPFVTLLNDAFTVTLMAKIINLLGVIINASLIMLISRKIAHGNLIFATLAGITAACFPALSGEGFHSSAIFFYFFIPLFLMGIFLFIEVGRTTRFRLITRIIALAALFISFSFNSLLLMFYALVPAVFYAFLKNEKQNLQSLSINARVFVMRHFDFLTLPLAFWALKEILMPREGIYARYNKINFDWAGIFNGYERLIPDILQTTLFVPFSIQFVPWIAMIIFIIVTLGGQSIATRFQIDVKVTKVHLTILLGLGFIALCGAALPYYMVGRRSFQAFGFMSRDNVLFPLGVSWITAALFCMFLKPQKHEIKDSKLLRQRIVLGVFCVLIGAQSLSNWRNHADWQAHYAYYRSAVGKIIQDKSVIESSVIHVVDNIPGDRTLQAYKYPTSIWTEIISAAFHKTTRLAISAPPQNGHFFTQEDINKRIKETEVEFMLSGINLNGKQIRLTIEPSNNFRSPLLLALTYWKTRFFSPTDMPKFLDSLTQVRSERIGN